VISKFILRDFVKKLSTGLIIIYGTILFSFPEVFAVTARVTCARKLLRSANINHIIKNNRISWINDITNYNKQNKKPMQLLLR